jgi:hypothetical protein
VCERNNPVNSPGVSSRRACARPRLTLAGSLTLAGGDNSAQCPFAPRLRAYFKAATRQPVRCSRGGSGRSAVIQCMCEVLMTSQ